jgi:non-heme chloroperoxidase
MASISERENQQIKAANASGNTLVVFIHGLWLLPSSWASWADFFKQAGYAPLTPDWPDDPETVEQARANPGALAGQTLGQVAGHTTDIITALNKKPMVMGHSTRGLVAQMLAGRGLSAATVAIDPGVFRGVLPPPGSVLKGVGPFLVNPLTRGRAITLTFGQFTYGWANALGERRPGNSTTPTTSPARGSLWCRWATRTSTRGPRRR